MKSTLTLVFVLILMAMTYYTVKASLDRSVLAAGDLLPDPWFQATLCDAYCGFLTCSNMWPTSGRFSAIFRRERGHMI